MLRSRKGAFCTRTSARNQVSQASVMDGLQMAVGNEDAPPGAMPRECKQCEPCASCTAALCERPRCRRSENELLAALGRVTKVTRMVAFGSSKQESVAQEENQRWPCWKRLMRQTWGHNETSIREKKRRSVRTGMKTGSKNTTLWPGEKDRCWEHVKELLSHWLDDSNIPQCCYWDWKVARVVKARERGKKRSQSLECLPYQIRYSYRDDVTQFRICWLYVVGIYIVVLWSCSGNSLIKRFLDYAIRDRYHAGRDWNFSRLQEFSRKRLGTQKNNFCNSTHIQVVSQPPHFSFRVKPTNGLCKMSPTRTVNYDKRSWYQSHAPSPIFPLSEVRLVWRHRCLSWA